MARKICVKPCVLPTPLPKLTLPFVGQPLKAQASIGVSGGCDGCEILSNFLVQMSPMMGAMGLPLCMLGCIGALIKFTTAVQESLGPPPDPSKLAEAAANIIKKCQCVVQTALPPPVGAICQFAKLVRDSVNMISGVVDCVVGMLETLSLQAATAANMQASANPDVQAAGACLAANTSTMTQDAMNRMGSIADLIAIIDPILTLLETALPMIKPEIVKLKAGFSLMSGSSYSAPTDALAALSVFKVTLADVAAIITTIVQVCP